MCSSAVWREAIELCLEVEEDLPEPSDVRRGAAHYPLNHAAESQIAGQGTGPRLEPGRIRSHPDQR
jgi:hypothetical protein